MLKCVLLLSLCVISLANVDDIIVKEDLKVQADDIFLGHKGEPGFIQITERNDELFYWFFPSQGDANTDPLVIWLTGGPGCSSELAIFTENGPFKIDPQTLKLSLNPYSWNKGANLLYVDQPIGTGYSNPVYSPYDATEDQVSVHFYSFLTTWLSKHPQFNKRELFIIGESYAGHYVPAISSYIAKHKTEDINLVGFGIGDGLINAYYQYPAYATFAYQNNLVSQSTYQDLQQTFAQCQQDIQNQDLDSAFDDCEGGVEEILGYGTPAFNVYDIRLPCTYPPLCYDLSFVDRFLQQEAVIEALGVQGRSWSECDNRVHQALTNDIFTELSDDIAYLLDNGYAGLLYYGEEDFICNWVGGLSVANNVNWSQQSAFSQAQMQSWDNYGLFKQVDNFTFIKVYKAGHLVPMDQPAAALDILETFIKKWAIQGKKNKDLKN